MAIALTDSLKHTLDVIKVDLLVATRDHVCVEACRRRPFTAMSD